MTTYVLTIATLAIALTILEIMQTDSNVSKFVRGLFSLFLIAALIAPIPGILVKIKDGSILNNIMSTPASKPIIDNSYITKINIARADMIKSAIKTSLSSKGLTNFEVTVNIDLNGTEFKIYSVIVKIKNKLSTAEKKSILDIVTEITGLTQEFIIVEDNIKK